MRESRHGITLIDKRKSKINEKKSEPGKGYFIFDKAVKFEQTPKKRGDMPDFVYKWVNTIPAIVQAWKSKYGAMEVGKDDDVYPSPLSINGDGVYQIPGGDLLLMKVPIDVWMKKREGEVLASNKAANKAYKSYEKMISSRTGGALGNAALTDAEKERVGL